MSKHCAGLSWCGAFQFAFVQQSRNRPKRPRSKDGQPQASKDLLQAALFARTAFGAFRRVFPRV
eukprot:19740-Lingulodinium_polyedra.AAC.1